MNEYEFSWEENDFIVYNDVDNPKCDIIQSRSQPS